jgi:hypothetical protein
MNGSMNVPQPNVAEPQLLEVVGTLQAAGRLTGGLHGGEQEADEHGDDGDHDQQFHQGERGRLASNLRARRITPPEGRLTQRAFSSFCRHFFCPVRSTLPGRVE